MFNLSNLKCMLHHSSSTEDGVRTPTTTSTSVESDNSDLEYENEQIGTFGDIYQSMFNCSPRNTIAFQKDSTKNRGRRGRRKSSHRNKTCKSRNKLKLDDCYHLTVPLQNNLQEFESDGRDEREEISEQRIAVTPRKIHFLESNDQNVSRKTVFCVEGSKKVLISQHTFVSPKARCGSSDSNFSNRHDFHAPMATEFTFEQSEVSVDLNRTKRFPSIHDLKQDYVNRDDYPLSGQPQHNNEIDDRNYYYNVDMEYGNHYRHDSPVCRRNKEIGRTNDRSNTPYLQHHTRGMVQKYVGANPYMRNECL